MNKVFPFAFFSFIFQFSLAFSQKVNDKFDRLTLSENFDSSSSHWVMVANNDNLFIVQDGEYILNRKTTVSPFAIISNYDFEISSFRMVTSLKLERTQDDEGSIGLLFMAQPGGKGGYVLEFNKKKEFRLRQITGGAYNYITGDQKSGGWTKSSLLSDLNLYNLVEVKSSNGNYDISVNNTLLMSFTENSYQSGKFGLIVGPGSKGRVDFLYLFSAPTASETMATASENADNSSGTPGNSKKDNNDGDLIVLTESIIKLKTQINKLTEQNEDLKRTIEAMKSDDQDVENQKKSSEKQLKQMQLQVDKAEASYDSLLKVNKELLKYKDMVAGNENSDLIITLSQNLKTEKANNEQLRKKNKELTDALAGAKPDSTKTRNQGKTSASLNKPISEEPADTMPKQDEFVLPKN